MGFRFMDIVKRIKLSHGPEKKFLLTPQNSSQVFLRVFLASTCGNCHNYKVLSPNTSSIPKHDLENKSRPQGKGILRLKKYHVSAKRLIV